MCPASPGGDAPPIFFVCDKENGPRPVQKKNAWAQSRRRRRLFAQNGGPNKRLPCKISVEALGAGPALLNLAVVSPRPIIAKPGYKTDLTCFSFRCRCLSPGGESKGEGPQPRPFASLGGVGETGEAPPAADEASLFRGSGAIGGPKGAGNRNAATVLKSKRPHVSGGGRRGRGLCAKDLSPSPRLPRGGG